MSKGADRQTGAKDQTNEVDHVKIIYENEWDRSVVHVDTELPYEENYQMRMLRHNELRSLVKVTGIGREGKSRYTFYPGNALSLEKLYRAREIKREDLETFTGQFIEMIDEIKGYLLEPDNLLLVPDLVFFEKGKYKFCYLPARKTENKKTLCTMFHEMTEYFVKRLDYRDTEGILLAYRLHRETLKDNFDLRKILDEYKQEKEDISEQKRSMEKRADIPDTAVFCMDEDDEKQRDKTVYPNIVKEEPSYLGKIGKAVKKLKGGRWGRWEDLITEIDGQEVEGHL